MVKDILGAWSDIQIVAAMEIMSLTEPLCKSEHIDLIWTSSLGKTLGSISDRELMYA